MEVLGEEFEHTRREIVRRYMDKVLKPMVMALPKAQARPTPAPCCQSTVRGELNLTVQGVCAVARAPGQGQVVQVDSPG
jgi:hypothetical protein